MIFFFLNRDYLKKITLQPQEIYPKGVSRNRHSNEETTLLSYSKSGCTKKKEKEKNQINSQR